MPTRSGRDYAAPVAVAIPKKRRAPTAKTRLAPAAKKRRTGRSRRDPHVPVAVEVEEEEEQERDVLEEPEPEVEEAVNDPDNDPQMEAVAETPDEPEARQTRDMATQTGPQSDEDQASQPSIDNPVSSQRPRLPSPPPRPASLNLLNIPAELRNMIYEKARPWRTWQPVPGIRDHPENYWFKAAWHGYFSEHQAKVCRQMRAETQGVWDRKERENVKEASVSTNWMTLPHLPRLLHMVQSGFKLEQRWLRVHPRLSDESRSDLDRVRDHSSFTVDLPADDYLIPGRIADAYRNMGGLQYEGEPEIGLTGHKINHLRYFLRTTLFRMRHLGNVVSGSPDLSHINVRVLLDKPERPLRHPWLNDPLRRDRDLVDVFHQIYRAFRSAGFCVSFTLIVDFKKLDGFGASNDWQSLRQNAELYLRGGAFTNDVGFDVRFDHAEVLELRLIEPTSHAVEY